MIVKCLFKKNRFDKSLFPIHDGKKPKIAIKSHHIYDRLDI